MYEEYFGLERPPFKITPDTSLFFKGGKRGDILDALVYAILRGEGILKVVGEVGSGKTMLAKAIAGVSLFFLDGNISGESIIKLNFFRTSISQKVLHIFYSNLYTIKIHIST